MILVTMHFTILSSTVKHAQLVTRQSKDNEITHSNVTHGLNIFCDQALALY